MPVADLLVGAGIHMGPCLACKKQHHQHGEEHHVAGEAEENKEADAMEQLARSALMPPVVIASASPSARGATVDGRLAADSWLFPFCFRWGVGKGRGHSRSSVQLRILSVWFGRMAKPLVGFPERTPVAFGNNQTLISRWHPGQRRQRPCAPGGRPIAQDETWRRGSSLGAPGWDIRRGAPAPQRLAHYLRCGARG